jgi:hypothetical protein
MMKHIPTIRTSNSHICGWENSYLDLGVRVS